MALPIRPVTLPTVLNGQPNGRLSAGILVDTPGQRGGPVVRLVAPAARAWRALCAAALAAGHTFKATSAADSYRSYEIQESTFRARYSTTFIAGRPAVTWQGRTWWLRGGQAQAAVPGTSNHGLGLAVDIGEELDGDAGTEGITQAAVAWLTAHAGEYGWSAELQSEPWHWRYTTGDTLPPAVLAAETPPKPKDDETMLILLRVPTAGEPDQIWAAEAGKYWPVRNSEAAAAYSAAYSARGIPMTLTSCPREALPSFGVQVAEYPAPAPLNAAGLAAVRDAAHDGAEAGASEAIDGATVTTTTTLDTTP